MSYKAFGKLKEFIELQTLDNMTKEEINKIFNHLKEENQALEKRVKEMEEALNRSGEWLIYPCENCQNPFVFYPKKCCSGHECGCMGKPTEPALCSDRCWSEVSKIEYWEELPAKGGEDD